MPAKMLQHYKDMRLMPGADTQGEGISIAAQKAAGRSGNLQAETWGDSRPCSSKPALVAQPCL